MCFIHRTHYSARYLPGTFEKCWLPWLAVFGWRGCWGRMAYLGGHCQTGVTLWFPCRRPRDLTLIHIWTWSVSRICSAVGDSWMNSMSDASVKPFYFWMFSSNWVDYYYCEPFNSLMASYWISGRLRHAVAQLSPALNVIGVLQLNMQWLAPT